MDHTKARRKLSELQGINPMIPQTLVLKPGLVIDSVYNATGSGGGRRSMTSRTTCAR
jgi:hypothetical protein